MKENRSILAYFTVRVNSTCPLSSFQGARLDDGEGTCSNGIERSGWQGGGKAERYDIAER